MSDQHKAADNDCAFTVVLQYGVADDLKTLYTAPFET